MDVGLVHQLVDQVYGVCLTSATPTELDHALIAQGRLESLIASRRLDLTRAVATQSVNPAAEIAVGLRSGTRDAKKTVQRMQLCDLVPQMGAGWC
ncbi:MAG TPA: hypothetical protein PKV27_05365, partial [Ilumatobacteraceae bacterium]|nr:hypothetical protein [Ilumatobacteraceae bacterium]